MLAQTAQSLPRFIATLAAPLAPADELVRVPLALTGRWVRGAREFAITRQDLESIVRNFRGRQNGEINVDYDHASEMPEVAAGGPIPSAGRIVRLNPPEEMPATDGSTRKSKSSPDSPLPTADSRFILYGWYEPTDRARRLIANREYRYISPAIDWAARSKQSGKPQGATLSTVALTNRPFLEEMPPIRLSDPEYRLVEQGTPSPRESSQPEIPNSKIENRLHGANSSAVNFEFPISNFDSPVSHAGGAMKKVQLSVVDGAVKVVHEDQEFFAEPGDVKACAEALAGGNTSGAAPAAAESPAPPEAGGDPIPLSRACAFLSEADAAGKSISAVEFFRGEVERELDQAVRTGKILPRRRDDWRKIALSDFPAFRRILGDHKPQVPLSPVGFSGTAPEGAETQVKLLAEQRMRERGITFGQALSEIGREQPELAREYRRAVSRGE
jgi:Mu-like prophage I protein